MLGSYAMLFFIALDFTFTTRHIHNCVFFLLWLSLLILSGGFALRSPSSILDTFWSGDSSSIFFAFSHCSWGSQGKNIELVCISFSSEPRFVRTPHYDLSILGGPERHDS